MNNLQEQGFIILDNIFTPEEVYAIVEKIKEADSSKPQFRKTKELFAIRQFLKEIPQVADLIFTDAFKAIVQEYAGIDHFVVKSIYFDKPEGSNWFVAWHQDLTISVDTRLECPGFGNWTIKQESFGVQPPVDILESIVTFRIHLDDTDEENGALKVIPGSHQRGVVRPDSLPATEGQVCAVGKGGVMIMRPLLLHASGRVTSNRQRRVIHIEFCDKVLPCGLEWAERL
jgi:ectoine hydroxylase-related dioxygenase (phytanoyl-CoA dioxygenase family)